MLVFFLLLFFLFRHPFSEISFILKPKTVTNLPKENWTTIGLFYAICTFKSIQLFFSFDVEHENEHSWSLKRVREKMSANKIDWKPNFFFASLFSHFSFNHLDFFNIYFQIKIAQFWRLERKNLNRKKVLKPGRKRGIFSENLVISLNRRI